MTGVHDVSTKWRQVQIQPGAQTEHCSTKAHSRTTGTRSKGAEVRERFSPRAAAVGVGMTTTLPASLLTAPIPGRVEKKRVLLIDTSQAKRELRAEVMRKFGMEVDC